MCIRRFIAEKIVTYVRALRACVRLGFSNRKNFRGIILTLSLLALSFFHLAPLHHLPSLHLMPLHLLTALHLAAALTALTSLSTRAVWLLTYMSKEDG